MKIIKVEKIEIFWLVLNDICNNRCKFCYLKETGLKSAIQMDLGYAKDLVVKMNKMGTGGCILIGGEPTLYPDLAELIGYIKKFNMEVTLVTNGRRLADFKYAKQLKDVGLDRVVVSVEGWDEVSHNYITQATSYVETKNGVKMAVNVGLMVETLTTISTLNVANIEKIYELLSSWNVKSIDFNFAIPQLKESGGASWEFTPDLKTAVKKIESLYGIVKRQKKQKFYITGTIPLCLFSKKNIKDLIGGAWVNFGCHMFGGKGIAFDAEGNVLPCTHFAGYPLAMENINFDNKSKINDFKVFLNRGLPKKFRNELWRYPSKKCCDCEYWGYCVGGCPLLWLEKDPSVIIG